MMVRYVSLLAAAFALVPTSAAACVVRVPAKIVVYGRLVGPPPNCPSCGPRVEALKVIRGPKQQYFQLQPADAPTITCYETTAVIGLEGEFGLMGDGPIYSQLYFHWAANRLVAPRAQ